MNNEEGDITKEEACIMMFEPLCTKVTENIIKYGGKGLLTCHSIKDADACSITKNKEKEEEEEKLDYDYHYYVLNTTPKKMFHLINPLKDEISPAECFVCKKTTLEQYKEETENIIKSLKDGGDGDDDDVEKYTTKYDIDNEELIKMVLYGYHRLESLIIQTFSASSSPNISHTNYHDGDGDYNDEDDGHDKDSERKSDEKQPRQEDFPSKSPYSSYPFVGVFILGTRIPTDKQPLKDNEVITSMVTGFHKDSVNNNHDDDDDDDRHNNID